MALSLRARGWRGERWPVRRADQRRRQSGASIPLRRVDLGLGEEDRPGKVGAAEVSAAQVRAGEIGGSQVRAGQVSADQAGAAQVGAAEVGAAEILSEQVSASEVDFAPPGLNPR